mgnify:CR=1 FL=1
MKATFTSIAQEAKVEAYVLQSIQFDPSEWNLPEDIDQKRRFELVMDEYKSAAEYPANIQHFPTFKARFTDWMQGLPSCLNTAFYYDEQRALLADWDFEVPEDDTDVSAMFYSAYVQVFVKIRNSRP